MRRSILIKTAVTALVSAGATLAQAQPVSATPMTPGQGMPQALMTPGQPHQGARSWGGGSGRRAHAAACATFRALRS